MSIVRRLRGETRDADSLGHLLDQLRGAPTHAGVPVDEDRSRRLAAVWAASELIAGTISGLPIDEFVGDERASSRSSIIVSPSASVTREGWMHQLVMSQVFKGNGYAWLTGGESGRPTSAETVHPDKVTWHIEERGGVKRWHPRIDGDPVDVWPLGPLFHAPLFQIAGCPVGLSPIEYHRQSIGLPIAAQKFGAQFFGDGGHPSIIVRPSTDPGADGARALKQKVVEATRGNRDPLVLPPDTAVDRMSINPDEAQFLETQRYGVEEVARIFLGGFPEMIGGSTSSSSLTYANREERTADFLAFGLSRYLVPLEASLSTLLGRGRRVKFNVNALLRADLAARYDSYVKAAEVGEKTGTPLLTVNEMRRLEDRPPIDGGDTFVRRPRNEDD